MKPRPAVWNFATAPRASLQCRYSPVSHWNDGSSSWNSQLLRHASSATAAAASKSQYARQPPPPAKTSRKSAVSAKLHATPATHVATRHAKAQAPEEADRLNPPAFTYPPDLTVAPRLPNQNFFSYLWKSGRAYLSFYKTGVSHVRQTRKLARQLRQTAESSDSRSAWQIIRRSRRDMLRLPAFGVIFLICGEWTPLLVLYMTPLVPEACRIPSQVQRELSRMEKRRHERQRRASADALRSPNALQAHAIRNSNALQLSLDQLRVASARYDCHSRIWDWLSMTSPKFLLQRNVRKKFEYLRTDDRLIERDGGHAKLGRREVERACIERGIDVLGKQEEELRRALAAYYRG